MDFETLLAKTPATLEEIRLRVTHALQRHPLCRNVQFDVVSTPRTKRGSNWTVSLKSVEPRGDRKSTRPNSSHESVSRMPSSA